jgi:hypothetical protein
VTDWRLRGRFAVQLLANATSPGAALTSSVGGLEELDRVAGGVDEQDL